MARLTIDRPAGLVWQPGLLSSGIVAVEPSWDVHHLALSGGAWVDQSAAIISGADVLFDEILASAPWRGHERPMYERMVVEPRLTTGAWPDAPPIVEQLVHALSRHYGTDLSAVSANLYRNGSDSVAWHGDRVGRRISQTIVAIVSLGSPRRFLMRPKGGGASLRLHPSPGDLLVMGGTCQRTWEHAVPKCAVAGPRISLMFREPRSFEDDVPRRVISEPADLRPTLPNADTRADGWAVTTPPVRLTARPTASPVP